MQKFLAALRMTVIGAWIIGFVLIVGVPVLIYCRIIKNPDLGLRLTRLLDRITLFLARIKVTVSGVEKIDPSRGYVYVSNHKSHADPPALYLVFPQYVRFMAKKELFEIPLMGFALRTLEMISVDRSNPEAASASIDRAVSELRRGVSILLFPEGTRSRNAGLLPFKKGAFVLALKAHAPIVPVTIIGSDQVLRPGSFLLYPAKIQVVIHDPVSTDTLMLSDRDRLLEQVNSIVSETYRAHSAV